MSFFTSNMVGRVDIKQRTVKRTNFVETGYNYLICHNNFPSTVNQLKFIFRHLFIYSVTLVQSYLDE